MATVRMLSGGAAMGLVRALEPAFAAAHGGAVAGDFGAVGAMRARFEGGEPADILILTAAIMRELADCGAVVPETLAPVGGVETAIAVRNGDRAPVVTDGAALRAALLAADAVYLPDPLRATAGIHFARVLDRLGVAGVMAERLRPHPSGAIAMAALAKAPEARPIGCTQVTEILVTQGVMLVMALPPGYDLTTLYVAGVAARATQPEAARALVEMLAAGSNARLRAQCGFV